MKILVTGGSGFLGQAVVKKLKRHGVTIFARNKKGKGRFVPGDVTDIQSLERAFPADVVIHLAATFDEHDPALFKINVDGTKNAVEMCNKYKVKQLIYMSSAAAIGDSALAEADSERHPNTRYGKSKRAAEDVVMNSGLNYTIIRAPVILGPSSMWLEVAKAAQKRFPIIGKGENRFHIAYVDDVAALIAKTIGNKKAFGHVFHVAASDTPTYKEFYSMLCDALGIEMTERHVPVFAAKTLSLLHETASRARGKKPKSTLTRSNINRIIRDRVVSTEKAKHLLGFTPKYDTRRAIEETVKCFKKAHMI